jgi:hypothetical protein
VTKLSTKSVWCDECKLKVFECEHLSGKDASAEVPNDIPSDKNRVETVFLAFNAIIPGQAVANVGSNPQVNVKPRRLVVDPLVADHFMILDIRIGVCSHFGASTGGGVSCAIFPPTPPKYQPVANLGNLPVIRIGQHVNILVKNRSPACLEFNALVWCDTEIHRSSLSNLELAENFFKKKQRTQTW